MAKKKKKIKQKIRKSVANRFRVTKTGKVLRWSKKKNRPVRVKGAMANKVKKLLGRK
jgi:hypothetical protein